MPTIPTIPTGGESPRRFAAVYLPRLSGNAPPAA